MSCSCLVVNQVLKCESLPPYWHGGLGFVALLTVGLPDAEHRAVRLEPSARPRTQDHLRLALKGQQGMKLFYRGKHELSY